MVTLDISNNRVCVHIPLDHYFNDNLATAKAIGGGRFKDDPVIGKHHHYPLTRLKAVLRAFPDGWHGKGLSAYVEAAKNAVKLKALPDASAPLGIMVPFNRIQRVTTNFLLTLNRALLLNPVGSGKSRCGIAWATKYASAGLHQERRGVLVVTKSVGKYTYQGEILAAVPGARVAIIEGRDGPFPPPGSVDFLILNWDIFPHRAEQIKAFGFAAAIFSESHKMKGRTTLRTKAGLNVAAEIPNILLETASFTPNRNAEAFPQLCILGYLTEEDFFWWHFHFCGSTERRPDGTVINHVAKKIKINRRGTMKWDFGGSSNSEELYASIAPFTFSVSKKEILPDLPDEYFTPTPVDITNAGEYREACIDFLGWVERERGTEAMAKAQRAQAIVKLGVLLRLAAKGVTSSVIDLLGSYVDAKEKVVVFSSYKEPLLEVLNAFHDCSVKITGDESAKEKEESIQKFQNDPSTYLCLCTTEAGGESSNLVAAHTVVFMSLPWSPKSFEQAYGRCHRQGQRYPVEVVVVIARRTVQVEVIETLYEKALDISKVTTGSDRSPNSEALKKILGAVQGTEVQTGLFKEG
jgi:hypothetical protein